MKVLKIITSVIAAILLLACVFSSFVFWFFGLTFIHTREYGIFVAGVSVTRENQSDILGDGTVSYDPSINTVIFDNANIESEYAMVGALDDIQIYLVGENKFVCKDSDNVSMIYAAENYLYKDVAIFGEGSLTIEAKNIPTNVQGISADNLTIASDVTVTLPDCAGIANGIVCSTSLLVVNKSTVTVNNGAAKYSSAVRVRGNAFLEEGASINSSVSGGSVESCKGMSINGDLILGKDASVNVSVDDTSAIVGEGIRVTGVLEAGAGASVTASAKKNPAIEVFGTLKACMGSSVTADSAEGAYDVLCHGAFLNYGTTLSGDANSVDGIITTIESRNS